MSKPNVYVRPGVLKEIRRMVKADPSLGSAEEFANRALIGKIMNIRMAKGGGA